MPKLRPTAGKLDGGVRLEQSRDEFCYAGYRFRRIGNGAYYVQSRSHPGSVYLTDSESGECSCWPFQRNPTQPCGHLRLLAHLKSKLTQTDT